ncbi:MAG: J domain-containing protein [Beijerinckiaceae bacterium]
MDLNSPLFARIRIRTEEAEAKARAAERTCQHPGCNNPGDYKAPLGRNREGQYIFLCLAHVQSYNKGYNYFQGMTDDAISDFQKDALTGHRPTWTIGVKAKSNGSGTSSGPTPHDPLGMFGQATRAAKPAEEAKKQYGKLALKSLDIMHLDENATPEQIRAKYKSWVKQLHPDANNGDRSREEKLREILKAYNTLKSAGHV